MQEWRQRGAGRVGVCDDNAHQGAGLLEPERDCDHLHLWPRGAGGYLFRGVGNKTMNLANLGVTTPWLIEMAFDLLLHPFVAYGYAQDFEVHIHTIR